ncbi:MAG: glycosyltransferase family 39 protein [Bacteroidales bacterium]|nr:glycosyltransferase family 39 protein [Bacteroidales bacterium]
MPEKLHRHFQWVGIAVYMLALLIVSVWFRPYALKPLWLAWGVGVVFFFFLLTWYFHRQWRHDETKTFLKKVFWVAFGLRAIYVGAMMFYYYYQTGMSMEYGAADSLGYHFTACHLADLAREGQLKEIFWLLNGNTMGFSDQGYILYLTTLYTCFGKNILGPRLLKALMSAYMCVAIYKLASRSIGEKTARLAAVMAVFMPQFIHYTGTYMKETELVFLATLALERMDYLIRSKRYTFWNIAFPILLTALTFGFRTIVGMVLIASFVLFILFSEPELISKKVKWIALASIAVIVVFFLFTPIGWEMLIIVHLNFGESSAMVEKYQMMGLKYAEYASYKYTAPGAFVLPLTNLMEVANENQKMMTGTYFVKNYLAFFAMWSVVVAIRDRRWRNFSLIGSYTILYALIIAFSFAFNSERYHLPVLPGFLIMAAFAMTRFRKKDFTFFYSYSVLLLIAIVVWNYLKLAARGLFF